MTFSFTHKGLLQRDTKPKSPVHREGWPFPLEIRWSTRRRKTIAVEVLPEGIRFIAPNSLSVGQVEKVFRRYSDELYKRWQSVQSQYHSQTGDNASDGRTEPFVRIHDERLTVDMTPLPSAKRCSVQWVESGRIEFRFPGEIQERPDDLRLAFQSTIVSWLKKAAKDDFSERVDYWSRQMNLAVNQLRLKDQKTRWGSCSTLGNINLNWRLIQAPGWVIDYVVVHELAHLREMNHSSKFWAIVHQYFPDYVEAKRWLRANGRALHQL